MRRSPVRRLSWSPLVPFLLVAWACLASTAFAQTTAPGDSWRWARFTVRDGLPSDVVLDVVDARDDTLWALTQAGIAWFDGFQWHPVPMAAEFIGRANAMVEGPDGRVYMVAAGRLLEVNKSGATATAAATANGDRYVAAVGAAPHGPLLVLGRDRILYEWDGRQLHPHAPAAGFGAVRSLLQAGRFGAWITTERGVFCWDGAEWRDRLPARTEPYELTSVTELPDERAWAYVSQPPAVRGLWRWEADHVLAPVRQQLPTVAVSLAALKSGDVYAAHNSGELTVLRKDSWSPLTTRFTEIADVHRIGVRGNSDVWVASDHGLFYSRRSTVRWSFLSFPPADGRNAVNDITRRPDGLWLATAGGLIRIDRTGGQQLMQQAGAEPVGSITGVVGDSQGRLWICSGNSFTGVRWLDRTGWHRLATDALLDRSFVHRIATDRTGGVWFLALNAKADPRDGGTQGSPGAFRLGPDGRITRFGAAQGLPNYPVYAFAEGPDGAYWFGTTAGLSRWHRGQWQHWTRADGMAYGKVFSVAVDAAGAVWVGHQNGAGVGRFRDGVFEYFTVRDGLASDDVWSVTPDLKGRVWVSCLGGLSVLENGNWTTFDHAAGLRSTRVWPVLPDGDHVYVGTNGGGLAILNLTRPAPAPHVVVDPPSVEAEAAQVTWRAFSWWGELESTDVPTRIQLDDGPWSPWTLDRSRHFGALTPGDHTVRLQAKSLLGDVSGMASAALSIPQPLYRRPGFLVPIAALLVVIVGMGVVTVRRQRRHRREIQDREAQLRHAHKMESVGRLAGAIAHDFNNLLTVISGNASILDDALEPGDARREDVEQIRVAADRAERLTRQLLAFARKQVLAPRPVDLAELIPKTSAMLRRLIGEQVELTIVLAPVLPRVFVDPGQLEQVLVNMAINARDAMPHGGTLTIKADPVTIRLHDPHRAPDTAAGDYVRLSVADTGVGMDAETAAQVFDPFFTTKESGTGLGLATCYGIIKQAGGQITIDTAPGKGTRFNVDLPVSTGDPEAGGTLSEERDASVGAETILLVEDEIQVRKLAATALRQRGYTVLEAGDGSDALRVESTCGVPIHLLITDVVMPIMRGTELARRFAERRPHARVLFISGFIEDEVFRQEMGARPGAFLAKPFSLRDLTRTVRLVLDGASDAT